MRTKFYPTAQEFQEQLCFLPPWKVEKSMLKVETKIQYTLGQNVFCYFCMHL